MEENKIESITPSSETGSGESSTDDFVRLGGSNPSPLLDLDADIITPVPNEGKKEQVKESVLPAEGGVLLDTDILIPTTQDNSDEKSGSNLDKVENSGSSNPNNYGVDFDFDPLKTEPSEEELRKASDDFGFLETKESSADEPASFGSDHDENATKNLMDDIDVEEDKEETDEDANEVMETAVPDPEIKKSLPQINVVPDVDAERENEVEIQEPLKPSSKSSCCHELSSCVWFDQQKLHPKVAELLYWRDLKKSGIAFGCGLLVLLSLTYLSFISVIAYLSLATLGFSMSFRIYKSVLIAVQKSNEGHPFKEYLDKDVTLSSEKVKETLNFVLEHSNAVLKKAKELFLVADIVDSIKFGLVLWVLTYVGSWFNGMTLVILGFVCAFSLPKVYETHKAQIDRYVKLAHTKVTDISDKVKSKIPMLNKKKEE